MLSDLTKLCLWFEEMPVEERLIALGILATIVLRTAPRELQDLWKSNLNVRLSAVPVSLGIH